MKKWKLYLTFCMLVGMLSGCGDSAVIAIIDEEVSASVQTQQTPLVDEQPENSNREQQAVQFASQERKPLEMVAGEIASGDENCETDSGLTCPLVKPVELMTIQFHRTPEQQARMEAFDKLSLEKKYVAMRDGSVVCKDFVHEYQWEHVVDPLFIRLVGRDAYEKWLTVDMTCQSVYSFAAAFQWTYDDLEKIIKENGIETQYDLAVMKQEMEA